MSGKDVSPLPATGGNNQPVDSSDGANNGVAKFLQSHAGDILANLPRDKRRKLIAVVKSIAVEKHYTGPIPAPEDIALFNQHIPNGADRIMTMAEDQAKHRMQLETTVVASQQKLGARGQVFALIIGVFGILTGAVVTVMGHDVVGGGIAGTTVISLVYAFITGKREQKKDLEAKRQAMLNS